MKRRLAWVEPAYTCSANCMCCPKKMDRTPQGPSNEDLDKVIDIVYKRFGRTPTIDELIKFMYGDDWEQFVIWNKEKAGFKCVTEMRTTLPSTTPRSDS